MKQVHWYVIHTTPRIERDIKQRLDAQADVWETFLPMQKRLVTLAGKRLTRYTPLIPGYLFVRTNLAFLRKFMPVKAPQCYLQLDALREISRPMTIADAEMERFKFFTERTDGQLTLLHSPYSQFKNNDRVKILTGPFAGYEGFIREIKRDNKLIFKVGNMAIAVSNILRYDVEVISNAVPEGETILVRNLVDHLLGRLQFLGFPDEAPQVLRDVLKYLGTERTPEDWLQYIHEKGNLRYLRAFQHLDDSEASYFLTLARYYFGKEPNTQLLKEISDLPLRPFLTQTVGNENIQPLTPVRQVEQGKYEPTSAEALATTPEEAPSSSTDRFARYAALCAARAARAEKQTAPTTADQEETVALSTGQNTAFVLSPRITLISHTHFTEALCPIDIDENRYQFASDDTQVERHHYVAHVGMSKLPDGNYLYFSNGDEFYSHYAVMSKDEREKLLAKLDKYGLTAFHAALVGATETGINPYTLRLGPIPTFHFSGLYLIFPGCTLGECLTSNPYHSTLLQIYLTQSLSLLSEIMQSPRLRAWQGYMRTVWLRG